MQRLPRQIFINVTPPGSERDTLDIAVFGDAANSFAQGGECRGLLYFYHHDGRILICNPTTKQRKFLPLSRVSEFPLFRDFYLGLGFGYDESSQDFKILRFFLRYGEDSYGYTSGIVIAETYSFRTNCWKMISCPPSIDGVDNEYNSAAHVNGNLYWVALFRYPVRTGGKKAILSLDLATEAFSILPLPAPNAGDRSDYPRYFLEVFELDGELGAFVYESPGYKMDFDENVFQIWVWKPREGSWRNKFKIPLLNIVRPLGLKHDLLFLEGQTPGEFNQLRVYDVGTSKLESLDVFAPKENMELFPYTRSAHPLPKDAEDASGDWV